jgi:very-short-patch-repair endonuclease
MGYEEYQLKYRQEHRLERRKYAKEFYRKHKLSHKKYYQRYYILHKKEIDFHNSQYRQSHKEQYKVYCQKNKDKLKNHRQDYYLKNRIKILRQKHNKWVEFMKQKRSDPHYVPYWIFWNKRLDNLLIKYWGELQAREIIKKFPIFKNRSKSSLQNRARKLGLHSTLISNPQEKHPLFQKQYTEEEKKLMSIRAIKKYENKGERLKISRTLKKLWKNPEYAKKQSENIQRKPTMPEIQVLQIIKLNNLPFNYTGNNKVWINGHNPDFLSKNPKHIIEVNGERWHQDKNRERRKKYAYSSLGYKMLTIWVRKIKKNPQRVTERIVNFITS